MSWFACPLNLRLRLPLRCIYSTVMVGLVGSFVITAALAQTGAQPASPNVTIQGQPEAITKPRSGIPKPLTAADLTGLQIPPDMVVRQNLGVPTQPSASNLLSSNPFNIAPGQAIDLMGLYQEAAFSDPVLNSARFLYESKQELFWQGLSVLMPQIVASPGLTRYYQHAANNSALQTFTGNSRVYGQRNYAVTLTQPLFNASAFEVFRQGDLNTKVADMGFYQAQQDLVLRVSQAYFDVLYSQDNVALFKSKIGLIKQQLNAAKARFEAGLATIVDVNIAQAGYDLAISQEITAQADLVVKRGILEQLVGRPVPALKPLAKEAKIDGVVRDPRAKVTEALPAPSENINPQLPPGQTLNDWIHQAENANFGVLGALLNVDIASSNYRAALATNYPTLNFVGSAAYNSNNGVTFSNISASQNIYNNTVALNLNIPIFSGGYNSSLIRQNAALVDKAKSDYDNLRRTAAQNTRQAFTGFYGGLASVKAYEAAERSTTSAAESSQLGFEVGTLISIDVLLAFDALINTRLSLNQARYNTIMNALKLKSYAGTLTDSDLTSINGLLR
ncbi:TolC family protein [Polynucleobacter sp. IMCC 30228]|uniref:TolC family protein n=1 Tax=Polynucleobacter sp. IMCC 30228 TaxID=2781011 RepID=UPI001F17B4BA|nr:TolC family protein [Polynucleobacter sp. IMCC 30228]MCE7526026.1 TolC family protein [Polynucleobacter sp. IMCC 30228]